MLKSLLFIGAVYLCTFIPVANNYCTIQKSPVGLPTESKLYFL